VADIAYQRPLAGSLLARVYQPAGTAAFAALLDVHGGDWRGGDRLQQSLLDSALAANGVLVAAIDYRLAAQAPYPASVQDVNLGTRWLRLHGASLGLGTGAAVGALGSSSGGHLAILSALRPADSRYAALPVPAGDAELDFVIADAPITDVRGDLLSRAGPHPYWPSLDAASEGSPMAILERGEAERLPPLLIIHGRPDTLVPLEMSERFVEHYPAQGGEASLRVFDNVGHAFSLQNPRSTQSAEMARAILQFIQARGVTRRAAESR
jgi:acetyl esterase/lipase